MSKGRTPKLACGPFLLALLLGACSERTNPSAEEKRQLDNAAEMLDSAPEALSNVDDNALGAAEEAPADAASEESR